MKKVIAVVVAVLMLIGLSACGNDHKQEIEHGILDRNQKILDEIDEVQEKSSRVSDLIDRYENGK